LLSSLRLQGVGPVKDLVAEFGPRLNLFVGDNGLGKSFLLDVVFWALTGSWPRGRVAIPNSSESTPSSISVEYLSNEPGSSGTRSLYQFEPESQSWRQPNERHIADGMVIYASADGTFSVWDRARNTISLVKSAVVQLGTYEFTPDELTNGLSADGRTLCNGLINDWWTWYYEGRESSERVKPFDYLEGVVDKLSNPGEEMKCWEPRRIFLNDSRKLPILRMPYGDVPLPHWSSGVRRVMHFAYLLVWAWFEHVEASQLRQKPPAKQMSLIVDEVDSHLHPKWQRTILPAILHVAGLLSQEIQVQVFASTHSPLILASVEPEFSPEDDRLFWFDLAESTVRFQVLPWTSHGDVVGWLTSPMFGLKQARSREAEAAIEAAEAWMRGETSALPHGLASKDDIHRALVTHLPGQDPFWPRWIVEARP
jgi:hypothetical protein